MLHRCAQALSHCVTHNLNLFAAANLLLPLIVELLQNNTMNVTGKLCQLRQVLQNCRNLCTTHIAAAYEGPGKTTVTFISKEIGQRLLVSNCDQLGFQLNTGNKVIGPTVLFPRYAICWNVASGKHINDASLSLFTILEPKPDLLIIGLDDKYDFSHLKYLQELVQKLNIATEIVSVHTACTIFNFVNEEGRYVVAALIPQKGPAVYKKLPRSKPQKQITANAANSEADSTKSTT